MRALDLSRVRYAKDPALTEAVRSLAAQLGLDYVDHSRVFVVRSWGSRARAVARIYSLPGAVREALGLGPTYVIEVISERFDRLPCEEKVLTLIHELMHIPEGFSGGLRPHGSHTSRRHLVALLKKLDDPCGLLEGSPNLTS